MTEDPVLKSRYNYFHFRPEGVIGYNARTGTFALLTKEIASMLLRDGSLDALEGESELFNLGFLHHGREIEDLENNYFQRRLSNSFLSLTIAPTLDCNYHCPYCYQKGYRNPHKMSRATQKALLAYIEKLIRLGRKKVSVTWYGGEPLLATDSIISMARQIKKVTERNNDILDSMHMISNGILLYHDVARRVSNIGISQVQISIDSYIYDGISRRGVIWENGEFSPILQNILAAKELLMFSIRINVCQNNISDIPKIQSILNNCGLKDHYYLARVSDDNHYEQSGKKCSEMQIEDGLDDPTQYPLVDILSRPQFAKIFQTLSWEKITPKVLETMIDSLKPRNQYCSSTSGSHFVIDPEGNISRCWHSAGVPAESIGNVHDKNIHVDLSNNESLWNSYSPFALQNCRNCKVLPLCMGGCPHPRIFGNNKPSCESIKFQMDYVIEQVSMAIDVNAFLQIDANEKV